MVERDLLFVGCGPGSKDGKGEVSLYLCQCRRRLHLVSGGGHRVVIQASSLPGFFGRFRRLTGGHT